MASHKGTSREKPVAHPKKTSIGIGPYSRPLNKHKRRTWKKYVGQGRP